MNAMLLGLAVIVGAPMLKDKKDSGIVGEWIVESETINGRAQKPKVDRRWTFTAEGKCAFHSGKAAGEFPYKYVLSSKTSPATIDIMTSPELEQPSLLGIIKVEDDTLTLCYARRDNGDDRPTKFESPDNRLIFLIVMKRVKPKD